MFSNLVKWFEGENADPKNYDLEIFHEKPLNFCVFINEY